MRITISNLRLVNRRLIIVLIVLGALGLLFYENLLKPETGQEPVVDREEPLLIIETGEEEENIEEGEPEIKENEEAPKETLLVKDDFEIILPEGWREVVDFPEVLAMAVDTEEETTYFSIKSDNLLNYEKEYSVEEYADSIRISLVQSISEIEFTLKEPGIIDGNDAFFMECENTQEAVDFKTLLVFIKKDNTLWAISFNTLRESWPDYKDLFYRIAESFNFKY